MLPWDTLTLTAAGILGQGVAVDGTGTMEAAQCVVTAIGTNMASSGKCTLIYVWDVKGNIWLNLANQTIKVKNTAEILFWAFFIMISTKVYLHKSGHRCHLADSRGDSNSDRSRTRWHTLDCKGCYHTRSNLRGGKIKRSPLMCAKLCQHTEE